MKALYKKSNGIVFFNIFFLEVKSVFLVAYILKQLSISIHKSHKKNFSQASINSERFYENKNFGHYV